jgi:hypothetical protein
VDQQLDGPHRGDVLIPVLLFRVGLLRYLADVSYAAAAALFRWTSSWVEHVLGTCTLNAVPEHSHSYPPCVAAAIAALLLLCSGGPAAGWSTRCAGSSTPNGVLDSLMLIILVLLLCCCCCCVQVDQQLGGAHAVQAAAPARVGIHNSRLTHGSGPQQP